MENTNKYNNAKIYRLINDIDNEFYIGSTCEKLARRKSKHKTKATTHQHRRVYSHLNEVGWDNVHIVLIEEYPCENIEQLQARERYWIEQLKPTLNKAIPLRTGQEWREVNKENLRRYNQEYHVKHKELISKQKREYYNENKDEVLTKMKDYALKNKEKIQQREREKVSCPHCSKEIVKYYLKKHIQTIHNINNQSITDN